MTRREEIAWAAGLLEGEGCFSSRRQGNKRYPAINCAMTDQDTVRRLYRIFGVGCFCRLRVKPSAFGKKPLWSWSCTTRQARAVMAMILPFMGKRRSARIKELLAVPVKAGNYLYRKEVRK